MASALRTPERTVARNVVAMTGSRFVIALAGFASLSVVFAHLGAHDFGIWAVLSGMAAIVLLADLGLGSAIVRQVAASSDNAVAHRTRISLGLGLVWGVLLAVVGAGVILVAWPGLASLLNFGASSSAGRSAALVLMVGTLMDGLSLPWRGVLEGTQRYDALAWINGATAVLGAGLAAGAVTAGGGLVLLAGSVVTATAARAAAVVVAARRWSPAMSPSLRGLSREDLRAVGGYGLRVQVTSVSGAVNLELDRFLLTGFFGPAVAGGFELGARVVNLSRLVPAFVLLALFPMAVSRTADLGPEWLDHFNLIATKYLTAFSAVGAAVLVACADPLIQLWLGEENWPATACIMILAPAYAVNLAAGTTGILTRVEGRPGRETGYALLTMVVNLALTWPLAHLLGPTGVPLATAVGITVGTVYFLTSYHRSTRRPIAPVVGAMWPSMGAAALAGSIGLLIGSVLPEATDRMGAGIATLVCAVVVVVVAGGVLALTGFLRAEDAARLRRMWHGAVELPVVGGGT